MCPSEPEHSARARLHDDLVGKSVAGDCGAAKELSSLLAQLDRLLGISVCWEEYSAALLALVLDEERSADFFLQ